MNIAVTIPDVVVAEIVERVVEIVLERLAATPPHDAVSEYVNVREAAEILRSAPQRVYDLLSAGRLTRTKDGSRVLVRRSELAAHLAGDVAPALPPALRTPTSSRVPR